MIWISLLTHIAICVVVGLLVSAVTDVFWLAAAFGCSAALFFTGSVAYIEDSMPGGFDNPDGSEQPPGIWFAIKSIGVALILALVGFVTQLWIG